MFARQRHRHLVEDEQEKQEADGHVLGPGFGETDPDPGQHQDGRERRKKAVDGADELRLQGQRDIPCDVLEGHPDADGMALGVPKDQGAVAERDFFAVPVGRELLAVDRGLALAGGQEDFHDFGMIGQRLVALGAGFDRFRRQAEQLFGHLVDAADFPLKIDKDEPAGEVPQSDVQKAVGVHQRDQPGDVLEIHPDADRLGNRRRIRSGPSSRECAGRLR